MRARGQALGNGTPQGVKKKKKEIIWKGEENAPKLKQK